MGRPVELCLGLTRRILLSQDHQDPTLGVELDHHLGAHVGDPDIVLRIHRQAMGRLDDPVSPGAHKFTVGLETHDGMGSPVEDLDPVLRVHIHARNLTKIPSLRQMRPVGHVLKLQLGRIGRCAQAQDQESGQRH